MVSEQTCSTGHENGLKLATDVELRLFLYIHHTNDCRQYCRVTRSALSIKFFLILQVTLKIQNKFREESCVSWEVEHLFP